MPKTQAEIDLEVMQSKYGKNELLRQALDRAVLTAIRAIASIGAAKPKLAIIASVRFAILCRHLCARFSETLR
jgi:hypothetical protein